MKNGLESEVRYYCREFPAVFEKAEGCRLIAKGGREYIDFFSGAGALNYGHNHPAILAAAIDYLKGKGVVHVLDMDTVAKQAFLEKFDQIILKPRGLEYKFQFPGPTGTNGVEAALKLARKATGRRNIFAFFGAFHGMSLGSLAATSNLRPRAAAGVDLHGVTFMPYPEGYMASIDSIGYIEAVLEDSHSGIEKPAAIIVETVQAEGGVNVAPVQWLKQLRTLCDRHEILLICDEIQVGCGRTGKFFSFELAGIAPDIAILSKSLSGLGLPLSLVLIREELDVWQPGEHSGTFRANQLGLVCAAAALDTFWTSPDLLHSVADKQQMITDCLNRELAPLAPRAAVRGLGMIQGIFINGPDGPAIAAKAAAKCFERGLIIETAGRGGRVIKLLPPLIIDNEDLLKGLEIISSSVTEALK